MECDISDSWISTHALREEGDQSKTNTVTLIRISTHALREEGDGWLRVILTMVQHFYPRPPRGGRRHIMRCYTRRPSFLPTPSARRATVVSARELHDFLISTHALREEGDTRCNGP